MDYYVSSLVLLQSDKCPHAFSCLKTGECPASCHCTVIEVNSSMALLENSEPNDICPYRLGIGLGQYCLCPTFVALNKQKRGLDGQVVNLQ